jgi:uncharacterized protein with von Willebrand factor type A (vWA) domain
MAFFSEAAHHQSELSAIRRHNKTMVSHLREANFQIDGLETALTRRHVELNSAIEELHRRDAVGSPAARELLKRQEEAMDAATLALDNRQERSNIVLESMERLLSFQAEQTAKMQQNMADLLQQIALQPRGNVTMQDSVLVQDMKPAPSIEQTNHTRIDALREINDWLKRESVSSP